MSKVLPKWSLLKVNFPAFDAATVARLVGGKVQVNFDSGVFTNFCCIRVSRALNLSGQPVPGWDDASGHADCWEDTTCLWRDNGNKAKEIYFWEAS